MPGLSDVLSAGLRPGLWLRVLLGAALAAVIIAPASSETRFRERRPRFSAPLPEARPEPPPEAPSPPAAPEAPGNAGGEPETCIGRLAALGIVAERAAAPSTAEACLVTEPVRLASVRDGSKEIRFPERPLLACAHAERVAAFARDIAAPLGRGLLNASVTAIGTGPGYECRPRNRVAGAKMSAHGRGLAIDIGWIELEGGRRLLPGGALADQDGRFIATLRKAACGWFTTVLGPGSDAAHHDHLHLDSEPRGRTGDTRLCQ